METFFVNPGNCTKLRSNIIEEIRRAKVRILVAVGFFLMKVSLKPLKKTPQLTKKGSFLTRQI
ncbi:hypothetical protein [Bacillus wiedmannii]|uniref:hypothetical protein n=1 Tax=Bacillus wiedmannii TaxID=1890302 RepID=UPI000BF92B76|nr:hypothetical protein [Bacillus wiedmannii]PGE31563.1 hypothetical protein COM52_16745 [Bacillus wiedmannii]PHA35482.1 hypothetical protein COF06_22265 [Bacillus wiedmannii]